MILDHIALKFTQKWKKIPNIMKILQYILLLISSFILSCESSKTFKFYNESISITTPANWHQVADKEYKQIENKDGTIALTLSLYENSDFVFFKNFSEMRFEGVVDTIWNETELAHKFTNSLNFECKLYKHSFEKYLYLVCVLGNTNYLASLTFVVEEEKFISNIEVLNNIIENTKIK